MNRKLLFIIITLFLSQTSVYSQNPLKGRVLKKDGTPIVDAVVEIRDKRKLINGKRLFKFTSKSIEKLPKIGYKPLRYTITLSNDEVLKLALKRDSNLDEVTLHGGRITIVSSRITYRINSAIYAEDTKAIEVLGTLLNVSFMGSNLIVDGREKALVFIDGMESLQGELKKLNVNELKEVKITSNPWLFYGAAAPLVTIKITTKKNI